MTPVRIATAMNVDTNPMVQPSLSMKNLQTIISTVPGLLPPRCKPGTVGLHFYIISRLCSRLQHSFTLVNMQRGKIICNAINAFIKFIFTTRLVDGPGFDPVNISGKYRDNAWLIPEGNDGPVFCRQSAPGTASKGKCLACLLTWRWSVFPAALSCKAQPVTSCLLY